MRINCKFYYEIVRNKWFKWLSTCAEILEYTCAPQVRTSVELLLMNTSRGPWICACGTGGKI